MNGIIHDWYRFERTPCADRLFIAPITTQGPITVQDRRVDAWQFGVVLETGNRPLGRYSADDRTLRVSRKIANGAESCV